MYSFQQRTLEYRVHTSLCAGQWGQLQPPGYWETHMELPVTSQHGQCGMEGCAEQGMIFPVNRAPGLSLRTTPSSWEEWIPISQTAKQRAKEQPLWEAAESGLEQH